MKLGGLSGRAHPRRVLRGRKPEPADVPSLPTLTVPACEFRGLSEPPCRRGRRRPLCLAGAQRADGPQKVPAPARTRRTRIDSHAGLPGSLGPPRRPRQDTGEADRQAPWDPWRGLLKAPSRATCPPGGRLQQTRSHAHSQTPFPKVSLCVFWNPCPSLSTLLQMSVSLGRPRALPLRVESGSEFWRPRPAQRSGSLAPPPGARGTCPQGLEPGAASSPGEGVQTPWPIFAVAESLPFPTGVWEGGNR